MKDALFRFMLWRNVKRLTFSCWLWDIRGLPTCPYHGFYAQSWWTGYCKECKEIPNPPPMEDICWFCGEEKAVLQRASPNGDKKLWSLCWECDKYIDWGELKGMMAMVGMEILPFDQWLFDREQVYPKYEYSTITLKRKEKEMQGDRCIK